MEHRAAQENASRQPAILLEGVSKSYAPGIRAVSDVTLAVAQQEFVSIVGGSGSGKTTLLKTINRLVEPDSGSVHIAGEAAKTLPLHELRRRIGYVFQQIGLFPHLTVAENIGITPRLCGWPEPQVLARVLELIEMVGLPQSYLPRMPAQLSGGERQRVGVARALAARPSIVLMDEPFGALDPITRDVLSSEYRRLHDRMNLTTVMVTHDVMEAVLRSDRIIVMRAGVIVADGRPHELLSNDADTDVRSLMEVPRRQAEQITQLIAEKTARG